MDYTELINNSKSVDFLNLERTVFIVHMLDGSRVIVQHNMWVILSNSEWVAMCEMINLLN
jgi:hypothetical protein